jgi:Ca2+-binding RTX toxin-like protein
LIGTSGPDTIVGTYNDDNIFGLEGNDRINDGFGSYKIWAGSGEDTIKLEATGDPSDASGDSGRGFDEVYGERGRENIDGLYSVGFLLIFGGAEAYTITTGSR